MAQGLRLEHIKLKWFSSMLCAVFFGALHGADDVCL